MRKIAYIGCLGMIGVITTEFGIIGILPQVATYYHISIDDAGWMLSAFALVIAIAGPFMTLFMSGFDRKRTMLISISLFLLSGMVSLCAPPFWLLLVARILPAFLQPVYISTAIAAATNHADKKQEHTMMAILLGGIGIATVTTVPFATYVAMQVQQWQASFLIQSIVSLVALVSILFLVPNLPVRERTHIGNQLGILQKPGFIFNVIIVFLMNAAMFTTYSYFAAFLQGSADHISGLLLLFGVMGIAGNFIAGKALSRSIAGTTAIFLVGLLLVSILIHYSHAAWIIALWGLLHTPCFLTGQAYMISAAREAPEFANSLSISFGNLGISIGTLAGGWVIAHQGVAQTSWAMCLFCMIALLCMGVKKALHL